MSSTDSIRSKLEGSIGVTPTPETGVTLHENGTAGLTPVSIPAVATTALKYVLIDSPTQSGTNRILSVSFDNGVTFKEIVNGAVLTWRPLGVSQIQIKSNLAGTKYEIIYNRGL